MKLKKEQLSIKWIEMKYRNVDWSLFTLVYNSIYPQTILAQFFNCRLFESHTYNEHTYTDINTRAIPVGTLAVPVPSRKT